jgi:glutamate racemase
MFTVMNAFCPDGMAGVCNTFHVAVDQNLDALTDPDAVPYEHLILNTANAMKDAWENGDTKQVVLATPATVASGIYQRYTSEVSDGQMEVIAVAAPAFAKAVNEGDHLKPEGSPERIALAKAADEYVAQIPANATSVWLCCTHYPALRGEIAAALKRAGKGHIRIIDPMRFQGFAVAENYWEWKLAGGAKTPGNDFNMFMVTSSPQEQLESLERIGNIFINQGDPNKPTVPMISTGQFAEVTPERLLDAIDNLFGSKPSVDTTRLPGQPNEPKRTPPADGPGIQSSPVPQVQMPSPEEMGLVTPPAPRPIDLSGLPNPATLRQIAANEPPQSFVDYIQNYGPGPWDGQQRINTGPDGVEPNVPPQTASPTPSSPGASAAPWDIPELSPAQQKNVADSFLTYQQAGGTATAEQFFEGGGPITGVMQVFDPDTFMRGQSPSIPAIAQAIAKDQVSINDAYQAYTGRLKYSPFSAGGEPMSPEAFRNAVDQSYTAAGGLPGTGKTLGDFAVEKHPPLDTSAIFYDPTGLINEFPMQSKDERDKIALERVKNEVMQTEVIAFYKDNPIIENGKVLVQYNPVTNRLEVNTDFLIFDPRANGVFPDGTKPALNLNNMLGRTHRFDLPSSRFLDLKVPATRPPSVNPETGDQFIRPGFPETNNKWVLSDVEKSYLPKVFAGDPAWQALETAKNAELSSVSVTNIPARREITKRYEAQQAPIEAKLTETYLAKRRNWAAFVIHCLDVLRLPRTEIAAILADQEAASPPPPIGGPRSINVPQLSGSGVQTIRDPVSGLDVIPYVDMRNISTEDLRKGLFRTADINGRGDPMKDAIANAGHRRGDVSLKVATAAFAVGAANFVNQTFIQPAMKKPDPVTPPIEKLTASVQEVNRTMQGFALQAGVLPTSLDKIDLGNGLNLFLSPVPKVPSGASRPTFEQLVDIAIQTNGKLLKDAGVDTGKLIDAARALDANKVPTGSGTTVSP